MPEKEKTKTKTKTKKKKACNQRPSSSWDGKVLSDLY